jgi:hypothetical protein
MKELPNVHGEGYSVAVLPGSGCNIDLHAQPGAIKCILLDRIFKEMITKASLTHGTVEAAPRNNNSIQFHLYLFTCYRNGRKASYKVSKGKETQHARK